MRAHLSRSFFGWYQRYRQDVENDEMEKVLQKLYELIAHAPGFEKNKLVCEENGSFSCTELASALIDTGTSWKAIQPMIRWLERISRLDVYRKLPVELLLVGMLPVGELWELIRRFDQQAGKFTVSVSPESEDWARRALAGELKLLDESLPVEQLLKAIDEYLEKCCGNLELSDKSRVSRSVMPRDAAVFPASGRAAALGTRSLFRRDTEACFTL